MSKRICLPQCRRCDVSGNCQVSTEARDKVLRNVNLTNVLAEVLCLNIAKKHILAWLICWTSIFRNGLPPQSPVWSDNTRVTRFAPPPKKTYYHTYDSSLWFLHRYIANDPWNCSSEFRRSENNLTLHLPRNLKCSLALFGHRIWLPTSDLLTCTKYWAAPASPWRTARLLKRRFTKIVKQFPTFYGIQWFITLFRITWHWTASFSKPISLRTISILSSHIKLTSKCTKQFWLFSFSDQRIRIFFAFVY
jgi:hypothetical protein